MVLETVVLKERKHFQNLISRMRAGHSPLRILNQNQNQPSKLQTTFQTSMAGVYLCCIAGAQQFHVTI